MKIAALVFYFKINPIFLRLSFGLAAKCNQFMYTNLKNRVILVFKQCIPIESAILIDRQPNRGRVVNLSFFISKGTYSSPKSQNILIDNQTFKYLSTSTNIDTV